MDGRLLLGGRLGAGGRFGGGRNGLGTSGGLATSGRSCGAFSTSNSFLLRLLAYGCLD